MKYNWKKVGVTATSHTVDKLKGAREIPAGIGLEIFSSVYEVINNWWLINRIEAFIFDTTAWNTGKFNSKSLLLERKIEISLNYLNKKKIYL